MKLNVIRYLYEPPGLEITPETEYEAAMLHLYWKTAKLSTGPSRDSHDGYGYKIKLGPFEPDNTVKSVTEKSNAEKTNT